MKDFLQGLWGISVSETQDSSVRVFENWDCMTEEQQNSFEVQADWPMGEDTNYVLLYEETGAWISDPKDITLVTELSRLHQPHPTYTTLGYPIFHTHEHVFFCHKEEWFAFRYTSTPTGV